MDRVWNDVCALHDIPQQGSRIVKHDGKCIAIFRTVKDEVFALEDKCPHKNGPLSQGIVHDHFVTCPLHNWVFDLASGRAMGADEGTVKRYAVQLKDRRVLLDVSALAFAGGV